MYVCTLEIVCVSVLYQIYMLMYICVTIFLVEFVDQFLAISTMLPGTESLYGLGEHKVSLQLKRLM